MAQSRDPIVNDFRERITAEDRRILAAVNRRIELVAELHAYKLSQGYPLSDPDREAEIIEALEQANPGPLTSDGLREIYAALIAEWRRQTPRPAPV